MSGLGTVWGYVVFEWLLHNVGGVIIFKYLCVFVVSSLDVGMLCVGYGK